MQIHTITTTITITDMQDTSPPLACALYIEKQIASSAAQFVSKLTNIAEKSNRQLQIVVFCTIAEKCEPPAIETIAPSAFAVAVPAPVKK
jgi:hypothetical protein